VDLHLDRPRIGRSPSIVILLTLAIVFSAQTQAAVGRTVLATVLNGRNQPIVDVEVDDFVVRESGQPREIVSAHIADYPIVVLVDNSATAEPDLEAIRGAAARFITRIGDRPVAVETFGGTPVTVASFADDRPTVLERVRGIGPQPAGAIPALAQAMANAAALIRGVDATFSSVVVISASPGNALKSAPTEFLAATLDSHAIVHVVEHRPGNGAQASGDLQALAAQTRGQFTSIYSSASFQVALDHLADQMTSEIMIDYIVPGNAPPKEDVTVGVKLPGARVVGMGVR